MSTLSTPPLESFRTACGAAGPLTLIIEGPEPGEVRERVLEQPFAVVGRDPRSDICLDEWHVSRRHAFLQMIDGRWFCVDLQSQTGTHWADGQRRRGWIDSVHGVKIGPYRIRVASEPAEKPAVDDPLTDRVPELLFLPRVSLDFLAGGLQQSTWRMTRLQALVGQAPDCKVRLVAPSVSKFHCALLRTRLGVWVVDLFGRNGIRVNGQAARLALLFEGDQIEVGQFIIRVCYDAPTLPRGALDPANAGATNHKPPTVDAMPHGAADLNGEPGTPATLNPLVVAEPRPTMLLPAAQNEAEAEVVERLLVPLVNEFRLMQSQMFEQFQQAVGTMFNMFNSVHREQTDLIRTELDRLNKLTQELHELQEELSKLPAREAPAEAKQPAAAPPPRPAPAPPPAEAKEPAAAPGPPPARTAPVPPPAAAAPPAVPPSPPTAPPSPPAKPAPAAPPAAAAKAPPPPPVKPAPPDGARREAAPLHPHTASTDDIHFWLTNRMDAIQRERQSTLQKIMNFLLGKGPQSS